ncbi:MAG: hypothetical protein A4E32_00899 [Methanomassiliicoccales archaeon PtaU1.Bin124]|nr:MAG: hypothetical protein A4E32_00899 [Methanomassiliicoccales archaeon PtaU1.Bin124]
MRCFNCAWEGPEEELVEKPGSLIFYDFVAQQTLGMEVTRSNQHCPKCDSILKSHRLVGGMVLDQGI